MLSQSHLVQANKQHQTQTKVSGWQRLTSFWQKVSQSLSQRSQLSIEQKTSPQGTTWWHVTDPRSGKSFYAETLEASVHWLEAQRLGK